MFPKIIDVFGIPINSYGVMIMIGFVLATYIAYRRLANRPWPADPRDPALSRSILTEIQVRKILEPSTVKRLIREAEERGERPDAWSLVERGHLSEDRMREIAKEASRRQVKDFVLDLGILSMIFGLLGGKITYVLQNWETYAPSMPIFDLSNGVHPLGALLGLVPPLVFGALFWRRRFILERSWRGWAVLLFLTLGFAVIGIRALYLYLHASEYPPSMWRIFTTWQSGFVLYGGVILGVFAGVVYTYLRRRPILVVGDVAAPSIMLGLGFGRIGCFLNGCCFGDRCGTFWGVSFPRGSPVYNYHLATGLIGADASRSAPVHPTQLYEAAVAFLLFFLLSKLLNRTRFDGLVLTAMLMAYSVWRFINEYLRADPGREVFGIGPLTFSQTVSLFMFAAGVVGTVWILTLGRNRVPESG